MTAAATLLRRAQSSHHEWYCTDAMYTLSCLRSYIKNQSSSLSGNAPFQEYNERGFGRERKQREEKRRERCSCFISWGLHTCKMENFKTTWKSERQMFSPHTYVLFKSVYQAPVFTHHSCEWVFILQWKLSSTPHKGCIYRAPSAKLFLVIVTTY